MKRSNTRDIAYFFTNKRRNDTSSAKANNEGVNKDVDVPMASGTSDILTQTDVATSPESVMAADTESEDTSKHAGGPEVTDISQHTGTVKGKIYRFQNSWMQNRSWLRYNETENKMYCDVCIRFDKTTKPNAFRYGCVSFRKKLVEDHERSIAHKNAVTRHKTHVTPVSQRPLESVVINMEQKDFEQMKSLFRTVYYLVQTKQPFSNFEGLTALQKSNGIKLGQTYCNDKQAKTFTQYIYTSELEQLTEKINSSEVYSFLSDGSTDRSVTDEEGVYIRYIDPESKKPATSFLALRGLEKNDSQHVFSAITNVLETEVKQTDWKSKLVGCCMDGASVNLGHISGVATRFKQHVPHMITVHCCAHRLELAIKDTIKKCAYYNTVEELLDQLYRFYNNSPLAWASLRSAGKALNLPVSKPTKATGTRWVAHHANALEVIYNSWPVIVTHLQQVASLGSGKPENKEKAKNWLKILTSSKFIFFVNFLLKYFKHVTFLSMVFQQNDATPDIVLNRIKTVNSKLEKLVSPQKLQDVLMNNVTINNGRCSFCEFELDLPVFSMLSQSLRSSRNIHTQDSASLNEDTQTDCVTLKQCKTLSSSVITNTVAHINSRFDNLFNRDTENLMAAFSVFDPAVLPSNEIDLLEYGNESVSQLYKYYQSILIKKGCSEDDILNEWTDLKLVMFKKRDASSSVLFAEFWSDVIKVKSSEFQGILLLVSVLLVIPTNSAECERGFSLMKLTKSDWRCRLSSSTLSSLMFINMNCTDSVTQYNPERAIKLWWCGGKKSRRPNIKPYGSHKSNDELTQHCLSDSDSELSEYSESDVLSSQL